MELDSIYVLIADAEEEGKAQLDNVLG